MVTHNMSTMRRMATMAWMPNMPSWSDRARVEDLLLRRTLVVQLVQPSFIAREVHVNGLRLGRHANRGSTPSGATGMLRVLHVELVRGIVVSMVLQEGTVREQ
jgi:hypothetical protein